MSDDKEDVLQRLEKLDSKKKMTLNRNGFIILETIEKLDDEYALSSELTDITGRSSGEIGKTLAAYEELYDIDLRYSKEDCDPYT